jgi:RimJ/RimL family protein N-acetyltransferase
MAIEIPTLETERLILRGFTLDDVEGLIALAQDPLIAEFIGYDNLDVREASWRQIALWMGHWALRGFGLWAVEERSTGAFIGRIGLWRPDGWPGTEVGWMLGRDYWGKGYATEAAEASVAWGFSHLEIDELVSLIRPANAASMAVAQRIGEHRRGMIPFRGSEIGLWAITRSEWEARRAVGG